jgi:hypothetical protein
MPATSTGSPVKSSACGWPPLSWPARSRLRPRRRRRRLPPSPSPSCGPPSPDGPPWPGWPPWPCWPGWPGWPPWPCGALRACWPLRCWLRSALLAARLGLLAAGVSAGVGSRARPVLLAVGDAGRRRRAPLGGAGVGRGRVGAGVLGGGGRGARHPGELEDQVDQLGLLGPAAGLAAESGHDRGQLLAVLLLQSGALHRGRIHAHGGEPLRSGTCRSVARAGVVAPGPAGIGRRSGPAGPHDRRCGSGRSGGHGPHGWNPRRRPGL